MKIKHLHVHIFGKFIVIKLQYSVIISLKIKLYYFSTVVVSCS